MKNGRFEVGDKVRLTESGWAQWEYEMRKDGNEICEVMLDDKSRMPYHVKGVVSGRSYWRYESDLELVESITPPSPPIVEGVEPIVGAKCASFIVQRHGDDVTLTILETDDLSVPVTRLDEVLTLAQFNEIHRIINEGGAR